MPAAANLVREARVAAVVDGTVAAAAGGISPTAGINRSGISISGSHRAATSGSHQAATSGGEEKIMMTYTMTMIRGLVMVGTLCRCVHLQILYRNSMTSSSVPGFEHMSPPVEQLRLIISGLIRYTMLIRSW